MSGMTGIDVLDFIRSQHLDVAVILTTAFSSEQVAIDALRHGADDYLRKPFDRGEFQAALDRTLARLLMSRQIARLRQELDEKQARLEGSRAPRRCSPVAACRPPAALRVRDRRPLPAGQRRGRRLLRLAVAARRGLEDFRRRRHGQGMPAALLMATVRAVIRAMVSQHGPGDAVQHTATSLDGDLAVQDRLSPCSTPSWRRRRHHCATSTPGMVRRAPSRRRTSRTAPAKRPAARCLVRRALRRRGRHARSEATHL